MEQKDLSKKTSQSLDGKSMTRIPSTLCHSGLFLFCSVLFVPFLFISCGSSSKLLPLHQGIFKKEASKEAIVLAVDVPYKVLEIAKDEKMSFYPWLLWAIRAGSYVATNNKYVIIDGQTVLSYARARGINPVVQYVSQYDEAAIDHLAFDDSDIDKLCIVANELGASYLIRARLLKTETKIKEGNSVPFLTGQIQFSGKPFAIEVTREVTIEFTVYQSSTRKILFTREFNSQATATWPNTSNADDKVSVNIASALLSTLSSQHREPSTKKVAETTVPIGKTVVLGRAMFRDGRTVKSTFERQCEITLESITTIGGNLLRFDFTLWNQTEERVHISLNRTREGKLDTYIVDNFNVRYFSTSSSLSEYSFHIRAEEKKEFYFVFPVPVSTVRSLSFHSSWDVRTYNLNETCTIEFKEIPMDFHSLLMGTSQQNENKTAEDFYSDQAFIEPELNEWEPIGGWQAWINNLEYPIAARKARIQGEVKWRGFWNEEGHLLKVEILKDIGGGCAEAVERALRKTPFKPVVRNGKGVKFTMTVNTPFKIQ